MRPMRNLFGFKNRDEVLVNGVGFDGHGGNFLQNVKLIHGGDGSPNSNRSVTRRWMEISVVNFLDFQRQLPRIKSIENYRHNIRL